MKIIETLEYIRYLGEYIKQKKENKKTFRMAHITNESNMDETLIPTEFLWDHTEKFVTIPLYGNPFEKIQSLNFFRDYYGLSPKHQNDLDILGDLSSIKLINNEQEIQKSQPDMLPPKEDILKKVLSNEE